MGREDFVRLAAEDEVEGFDIDSPTALSICSSRKPNDQPPS
jgi:hypothetical protein